MKDPFLKPVHIQLTPKGKALLLKLLGQPDDEHLQVILCTPWYDTLHVEDAELRGYCKRCEGKVWISPSSFAALANGALCMCLACLDTALARGELDVVLQ